MPQFMLFNGIYVENKAEKSCQKVVSSGPSYFAAKDSIVGNNDIFILRKMTPISLHVV